jgi:hypothetical protein
MRLCTRAAELPLTPLCYGWSPLWLQTNKILKKNTEHDGGGWREEDLIISHKYSTQHEGERVVVGKREREKLQSAMTSNNNNKQQKECKTVIKARKWVAAETLR